MGDRNPRDLTKPFLFNSEKLGRILEDNPAAEIPPELQSRAVLESTIIQYFPGKFMYADLALPAEVDGVLAVLDDAKLATTEPRENVTAEVKRILGEWIDNIALRHGDAVKAAMNPNLPPVKLDLDTILDEVPTTDTERQHNDMVSAYGEFESYVSELQQDLLDLDEPSSHPAYIGAGTFAEAYRLRIEEQEYVVHLPYAPMDLMEYMSGDAEDREGMESGEFVAVAGAHHFEQAAVARYVPDAPKSA